MVCHSVALSVYYPHVVVMNISIDDSQMCGGVIQPSGYEGSIQSLDWTGGLDRWTGLVD